MCDFSLHAVRSRPAKVGDKLTTRMFISGTTGFCAPEDNGMAVCLLPGTELYFADEVRRATNWPWKGPISYKTAVFRQIGRVRDRAELGLRSGPKVIDDDDAFDFTKE